MFEITKEFRFEAAHALSTVPPGHKCSDKFADGSPRIHGHSYTVTLLLETPELDRHGFVVDYVELDAVKHWIDTELDHRNLNDVCGFPTTAENIAAWIFQRWSSRFPQLTAVMVCETAKTSATYRP